MKKIAAVIGLLVIIGVVVYISFFNTTERKYVSRTENIETYTEKVQAAGEPLDYNFGKDHKVVKAIVADGKNSKEILSKKLISIIPFSAQALTIRKMLDQLQDNPAIDSETFEKMEGVVNKYFSEDVMKEMLEKALTDNLSREELAEVLAWQETPIAQQANDLSEKAMDPDYAEEMATQLKDFDRDSLSPERKNLLKDLDEATGGSKNAIENMVTVQMGMMKSMMDGEEALSNEQISEMGDNMRESLAQNLIPQVQAASELLYKDVPDEDIKMNIQASSSDAVKKFRSTMQDSSNQMLGKFGGEFGSTMKKSTE